MRKYAYKCIILISLLLLTGCNVISALSSQEEDVDIPSISVIDIEAENARLLQQIEFEAQRIELFRANQDLDFLRRDFDLLTQQHDRLQNIVESLESSEAVIAGNFVATVRHLMPNYILDNQLRVAVLTEFQNSPFMLEMDVDIIQQLTVGQTYFFEIEATPVGEVLVSSLWQRTNIDQFNARVVSARPATSSETGINPRNIWLLPVDFTITDRDVVQMYQSAREAMSWFNTTSITAVFDDSITIEGEAAREMYPANWDFGVVEPMWIGHRVTQFTTMNELVEHLRGIFDILIIEELFENWGYRFAEIDGVLYTTIADRGGDRSLGECEYEIIRVNSFEVIYRLTVERYVLDEYGFWVTNPDGQNFDVYDFYLVFDTNTRSWRFRNFEIV